MCGRSPRPISPVAALMAAYMRETYAAPWHGSAQALERDAFGARCRMLVAAVPDGTLVGFIAWMPSYDLHHCVPGAEVPDLYVAPGWRSRGVAPSLGCGVAAEVLREGGLYMKGSAVEGGAGRRLYGRFMVCGAAGDCIVSGRAFRRLAELAERTPRETVRGLPQRAWNYEA